MTDTVTPDEKRNGWDESRLRAYLAERDEAVNMAHRLGAAGRDAPRRWVIEGSAGFDPMEW